MSFKAILSLPRRSALLGALLLAGCGFAPVYAPTGGGSKLQGKIAFALGEDRFDYRLREQLERRLGRTELEAYRLAVITEVTESPIAIAADNTATRINLPVTAHYTLSDAAGGTIVQGTVQTFTSYSATGTSIATRSTKQAAEDRLAAMVADLVVARILAEAGHITE